jgi:ABC-type branched-subunit amino acid transport system substrate-binding protein
MLSPLLQRLGRVGEGIVLRLFRHLRSGGRPGIAATLIAGATIALSACSSTMFGGGGDRAGSDFTTSRENAPVTGEVLGSGQVRVALLLPLSATGNAGQIATTMKNAADLAIREFQTANIQLLVKDDRGTPEGAQAAASQAIAEGATLILGPLFAKSVTAAASVAKPANIPIVAFSNDTSTASKGVYLLSFLPQSDVDRVISYAASQGKRSYVALLPSNAYGTIVEAALQRSVANTGGRVMGIERYTLDRISMQEKATAIAGLVKSGTVDTIFMPDAGDAAPFLGQVLAANGVQSDKIKYLGSGQWDDARIAAESNLNGAWYPAPDNSGFNAFSKRYQAAFGSVPGRTATLAYDATSLAAGLSARFGPERFSDQILTNPSGFIGLDGAFRLLANGTNDRGLAVYEIDHGQAKLVSPAPRSFSRGGA